ncbi:GtrA family protein [Acidianus brierleyi]|uniref:GtrA family protein n=1 Tax=Acidianus brierleyi TaxID=41673 RepID=A0A2U9IEW5_9CREN|nr:GtrA family protein [Acidianus brierleyi]AWR94583.1 GtrA family protein [Acidianus brierleyi]
MSRLLKFAIVGGLGTLVNELVFLSTTKLLSISISLALAIEISIIFNFMLNDVWTFKDKRIGNIWKRLLKFHMSSASGGIIQYIVVISIIVIMFHFSNASEILAILFFTSYLKLQSLVLGIINFIGIISGFIVRFITSIKWVWP